MSNTIDKLGLGREIIRRYGNGESLLGISQALAIAPATLAAWCMANNDTMVAAARQAKDQLPPPPKVWWKLWQS